MLYVILLLILAVLLFGSSVVLGAMGWVLGSIVAVIALVWASVTFDIGMDGLLLIIGGAFAAAILLGVYAKHRISENERPVREALAKMTPEQREQYEEMKARSLAKVRAETEAKKRYG